MTYQEKIESKIEYAKNKAVQLKESSDKFFEKGFCETTGIPMGQPILVGHHSEKRHRNAIERYDNQMRKNIDDAEKAKYYDNKAKRLENNKVISSDDPEAVTRLKSKLKALVERRQKYKDYNKTARKEGKESLNGWVLSNLSQNIRSVKLRIESLEKQGKIEEIEGKYGEITLKVDKEDNRVRLFFPDKPEDSVRTKLKSNGFRWSPYNKAWQRQLNEWSLNLAREIAQEVA